MMTYVDPSQGAEMGYTDQQGLEAWYASQGQTGSEVWFFCTSISTTHILTILNLCSCSNKKPIVSFLCPYIDRSGPYRYCPSSLSVCLPVHQSDCLFAKDFNTGHNY